MFKLNDRHLRVAVIGFGVCVLASAMTGAQPLGIFDDGFESGDTTAWSVARGSLEVSPEADPKTHPAANNWDLKPAKS